MKRNKNIRKILLSVFTVLTMIVTALPFAGLTGFAAETYTADGFNYIIENGGATITGLADFNVSELTIPAQLDGINVLKIDESAFENNITLTSVTVSDGINIIGRYAFSGCINLTNVDLGSISEIDQEAFLNCIRLKSVVIPKTLTTMNYDWTKMRSPFASSGLEKAIVEEGTTVLPWYLFFGCTNLKTVVLPENAAYGTYEIKNNVFAGCTNLEQVATAATIKETIENPEDYKIIIPDNVTSIGEAAFENCNKINTLELGEKTVSIGNSSFGNCTNLVNADLKNLTEITRDAFADCVKLKTITIPKTLTKSNFGTTDAKSPFVTSGVETVIFEEGTTSIPKYLFINCVNLKTVILPENTEYGSYGIGDYAFSGCTNLEQVVTAENYKETVEKPEDYRIIIPDKVAYLYSPGFLSSGEVFLNCKKINTVVIGDGIEEIYDNTFAGCTSLKNVTIPYTVKAINENAFLTNSGIEKVTYIGTESEWETLKTNIEKGNEELLNAEFVFEEKPVIIPPADEEIIKSDNATGVSAKYEKAAFDSDVNLKVTKSKSNDAIVPEFQMHVSGSGSINDIYNISLVDASGKIVQPKEGKKVTLKIKAPSTNKPNAKFYILHKNSETGVFDPIIGNALKHENGYLIFDVTHFSYFAVVCDEKAVSSVSIASLPAKTSYTYKMDSLDLSGLALTVTYADGVTETVTDTSKMNVTGFDNSKTGTQTVTVEYEGVTASFDVTVSYAWWQWIIRILLLGFLWY